MVDRWRRPLNAAVLHLIGAAALLAAGGCSTQVRNTGTFVAPLAQSGIMLPRPQRILVAGFEPDWTQVQLDRGIGARLQRELGSGDADLQQSSLADEVHGAITDTLARDLSRMGFATELSGPGVIPRPGDFIVQGQIVSIDQGNRTRRLAIGFGAGESQVRAAVQTYLIGSDAAPRLLQTYSAESNSGRKPGLALGGAGVIAQGSAIPLAASTALGATGEVRKAGVAGEGQRLADRVAQELGQFFAAQGWIGPR